MRKSKATKKAERPSISKARSYEEMAEFWDSHDVTEFEGRMKEVHFDVEIESRHHYVGVDPQLMERVTREAKARGISSQSLVNLILQEALTK